MWDVRRRWDDGQLILVGALSLAIVLVGIALVLNASIYAENLATRANQQEPGEVMALEREADQGAGVAMEHIHHDLDSHASYTDLENDFDDAIDQWSYRTVRDSARKGQYLDVKVVDTDPYTRGTRITQDDGGKFEPRDEGAILSLSADIPGIPDYWVPTPGESTVRDFSMEVDYSQLRGSSLVDLEASAVESFLLDVELGFGGSVPLSDPPFTVGYDVNDDGDLDHSFAIYQSDTGPNDVKITYANYQTGETRTCTVEDVDSTFTVDVSNGRVEGGDGACRDVFAFQSDIEDPYQLLFIEGDQIGGDYEFIVNQDVGGFKSEYNNDDGGLDDLYELDLLDLLDIDTLTLSSPEFDDYYHDHPTDHDEDAYGPSSPYIEPALYSAKVGLDYESDSMSYESETTVAPNRP